jgi:hypothetical protein
MANKVLALAVLLFIGGLVYFGSKVSPRYLTELSTFKETAALKDINNKTAHIL